MDIAAAALRMQSVRIANEVSILLLKNVLEITEQTYAQLLDPLLSLPVGNALPARLDISV